MKKAALTLAGLILLSGLLWGENPKSEPPEDLTIDDAVATALRQNPTILRARQEIERLRGVTIEVRSEALPQIGINSSYTQRDRRLLSGDGSSSQSGSADSSSTALSALENLSQTATGTASGNELAGALSELQNQSSQNSGGGGQIQNKTWRIAIEAQQTLYAGGRISAALKIASFTQDSSYYRLSDTIDTVIATVRQQFYQVLLNRATIRVQQESLKLLERQLTDQTNRFDAGTVPRFNVLQAEVALENARPDLIRARNNYRISQLELARTLNIDFDPNYTSWVPFNVVGILDTGRVDYSLEGAMEHARAHRPFLKVQRQQILIEVQQIKIALAGYQPTIAANGGYEVRNRITSDDLSDSINGWFFGFTGTWNIFDGFQTYGRTKQAKARLEQAKITYEDSVHQVGLEVQQADAKLKEASELLESSDKTIEQAQESLRLSQERLTAGAGVQLDVLNARVALLQAQTTALQARYDYQAALAEFDRATGSATRYEETFDDPLLRKYTPRAERKVPRTSARPIR